jgi:hypothetical protein
MLQVQNSVHASRLHLGLEGLPALVPGFNEPAKSISQIFPLPLKRRHFDLFMSKEGW